ncbi:MAG: hypothetical protein HY778_12585 [Betaproteobacteria bacterium]|nr:hypothetical protein [Betaproteobacteria bacterium]
MLVILAVAMTAASFSMRINDERTLRQESERLALLLELGMRQARLGGDDLAWSCNDRGYAFWKAGAAGQWEALPGDAQLRPRELPGSLRLAARTADGRPLAGSRRYPLRVGGMGRLHVELRDDTSTASIEASPVVGKVELTYGRRQG